MKRTVKVWHVKDTRTGETFTMQGEANPTKGDLDLRVLYCSIIPAASAFETRRFADMINAQAQSDAAAFADAQRRGSMGVK